jgi:hypothetical protein
MCAPVTNHTRICALVQSCESIVVRARTKIFHSSESIGVLARAHVLRKMRARARTKSCAHICVRAHTFSNIPKALVCLRARMCFQKMLACTRNKSCPHICACPIMRKHWYACAHSFSNLSKALVCLRSWALSLKMDARAHNKSCAHMCASPIILKHCISDGIERLSVARTHKIGCTHSAK